jgi:site-specific DNA recombinase
LNREPKERLTNSRPQHDHHLQTLKKKLDGLKTWMDRLCYAIENGILPGEITYERSRNIQARRQALLAEIAGLKRQQEFPLKDIGTNRIKGFCNTLQTKLFDKESKFGKEYLKLLVEEIRIDGKDVRMSGGYADVANALQKNGSGYSHWSAQSRQCVAPHSGLEIRAKLLLPVRSSIGFSRLFYLRLFCSV